MPSIGGFLVGMESPIVIEHRDALVYTLNQAAELEHGIMCQYLFAAFSMKTGEDEGLTDRELLAVQRWHQVVTQVATEEMLHLALVNNMLASLGAAPRVGRPNLPHRGRYYPPGVQLALVPFGERALRHFLFLERPEGISIPDAEGFDPLGEAEPLMDETAIVPRPQNFQTVGYLYRSIERGFRRLVEKYGEEWVFIGDERSQATSETFYWKDLIPVVDLKSAIQAVGIVVEQGEGPRGHWRDAHYGRFLEVLGEFLTFKRERPEFEPARPVVPAHVRQPVDADAMQICSDPLTARISDSFNVAYEILLFLLARFFAHGHEDDEQLQTLADAAVLVMIKLLRPLGETLTSMPLGPEDPDLNAGPSFEVFHFSGYLLPHTRQAWIIIHERMLVLEGYLRSALTDGAPQEIEVVADDITRIAALLAAKMPGLEARPSP